MSGFSFFGDNPIFNMVRIGSLKMSHACAESVTWDRHVMHSGRTAQIIIEMFINQVRFWFYHSHLAREVQGQSSSVYSVACE